jgi:hypothetical protein
MKKIIIPLLIVLLSLGTAGAALALTGYAYINQTEFAFDMVKNAQGNYSYNSGNGFSTGEGFMQFNISTNIDPFISYGLSATNFTPAPILFALVIPAFPVGPFPAVNVTASISGGLTDATGDGVTIAPFFVEPISGLPLIQINATNAYSWGVGGAFSAGPAGAYGYAGLPLSFAANNVAGPHALFGEVVGFTLSGLFDVASLTGYCSVNPVPLPGAVWLLGSGLMGLAGLGLRRRKS